MAQIVNFKELDVKYAIDSDQALKSRSEMNLKNLKCGTSDVALETLNKNCFAVVMNKQRKKAYILIRADVQMEEDLYSYATNGVELFASTGNIGLL